MNFTLRLESKSNARDGRRAALVDIRQDEKTKTCDKSSLSDQPAGH